MVNPSSGDLDPAASDLDRLLVPCPADELEKHVVDPIGNNVRNQGPQYIVPLNSV